MEANKQFSLIPISLVYDKSDQYGNVQDSYNVELASKSIKTILLENTNNSHSSFNKVKFDLDEDDNQYQLYLQFVAQYCNGLSMVPLSDYAKNETYKELSNQKKYFRESDDKIFIDLRRRDIQGSLKN